MNRDYFPPPRKEELVYTMPPPDAETLAEAVERIAGAEQETP